MDETAKKIECDNGPQATEQVEPVELGDSSGSSDDTDQGRYIALYLVLCSLKRFNSTWNSSADRLPTFPRKHITGTGNVTPFHFLISKDLFENMAAAN